MVKAKIYKDPLTREVFEGEAVVLDVQIRPEPGWHRLYKRCKVSFDSEPEVVFRLVHVDDFYEENEDD